MDTSTLQESVTVLRQEVDELRKELHKKNGAARVWDLIMRGSIPVLIIVAGAMVRNEVVDARQDTLLIEHRRQLDAMPPGWLQKSIEDLSSEVREQRKEINSRLSAIETRIGVVESKVR